MFDRFGLSLCEISRNFIEKDTRPVEVMCWVDTRVHPIDAEDNAVGLVKYENGAIGQFEVSWTFRGGMDLRDEVMGTEGSIWANNFLRTGFEMYEMVDLLKPFNVNVALLPINEDKPERKVAGNLNCKEAAAFGKAINAIYVIPCHYDLFEFNTADVNKFVEEAKKVNQQYAVLKGGQKFSYQQ